MGTCLNAGLVSEAQLALFCTEPIAALHVVLFFLWLVSSYMRASGCSLRLAGFGILSGRGVEDGRCASLVNSKLSLIANVLPEEYRCILRRTAFSVRRAAVPY